MKHFRMLLIVDRRVVYANIKIQHNYDKGGDKEKTQHNYDKGGDKGKIITVLL